MKLRRTKSHTRIVTSSGLVLADSREQPIDDSLLNSTKKRKPSEPSTSFSELNSSFGISTPGSISKNTPGSATKQLVFVPSDTGTTKQRKRRESASSDSFFDDKENTDNESKAQNLAKKFASLSASFKRNNSCSTANSHRRSITPKKMRVTEPVSPHSFLKKSKSKDDLLGNIFGIPLEDLAKQESQVDFETASSETVKFIRNALRYLCAKHKDLDAGLVLQLATQERQQLKEFFLVQAGKSMTFSNMSVCNENVVCALLRIFFSELPTPLLGFELFDAWLQAINLEVPERSDVHLLTKCYWALSSVHRSTVKLLFQTVHSLCFKVQYPPLSPAQWACIFGSALLWKQKQSHLIDINQVNIELKKVASLTIFLIRNIETLESFRESAMQPAKKTPEIVVTPSRLDDPMNISMNSMNHQINVGSMDSSMLSPFSDEEEYLSDMALESPIPVVGTTIHDYDGKPKLPTPNSEREKRRRKRQHQLSIASKNLNKLNQIFDEQFPDVFASKGPPSEAKRDQSCPVPKRVESRRTSSESNLSYLPAVPTSPKPPPPSSAKPF